VARPRRARAQRSGRGAGRTHAGGGRRTHRRRRPPGIARPAAAARPWALAAPLVAHQPARRHRGPRRRRSSTPSSPTTSVSHSARQTACRCTATTMRSPQARIWAGTVRPRSPREPILSTGAPARDLRRGGEHRHVARRGGRRHHEGRCARGVVGRRVGRRDRRAAAVRPPWWRWCARRRRRRGVPDRGGRSGPSRNRLHGIMIGGPPR
jgi:hypothetical protein